MGFLEHTCVQACAHTCGTLPPQPKAHQPCLATHRALTVGSAPQRDGLGGDRFCTCDPVGDGTLKGHPYLTSTGPCLSPVFPAVPGLPLSSSQCCSPPRFRTGRPGFSSDHVIGLQVGPLSSSPLPCMSPTRGLLWGPFTPVSRFLIHVTQCRVLGLKCLCRVSVTSSRGVSSTHSRGSRPCLCQSSVTSQRPPRNVVALCEKIS